ncbi:helix-turn-helix domain-containing protein [Streptomyces sp. NPDC001380]|uniref:AraC-like ligand-binding domain-containing protein n=1 Tax=Streptomyces sp. NPDC001380 TaxID=3364566 RepID=UPI0036A7D092
MTTVVEFRTDRLPRAERFDRWHDMTAEALIPNLLRPADDGDFLARARLVDLGAVRVTSLAYPPLETRRTSRLIARAGAEYCQVMLTLRGGHRIVQAGRDVTAGAGDLLLYDCARPWEGWAGGRRDAVEGVLMQFPRALLAFPGDRSGRLPCLRVPGGDTLGSLLSGHLVRLASGAADWTAADAVRLGTVSLDLLAAVLARHLRTGPARDPGCRERVLRLRVHAFIEEHLGDPGLTPAAVAAAHNVSLRLLHRLFQHEELGVAAWIRARRLERCRRDLADPLLRDLPVHAVARRWGFTDAAHFSRTFRAACGMTPTDYRELARSAGAPGPAGAPAADRDRPGSTGRPAPGR